MGEQSFCFRPQPICGDAVVNIPQRRDQDGLERGDSRGFPCLPSPVEVAAGRVRPPGLKAVSGRSPVLTTLPAGVQSG
jgi:hypothetical protein